MKQLEVAILLLFTTHFVPYVGKLFSNFFLIFFLLFGFSYYKNLSKETIRSHLKDVCSEYI